MNVNSQNNTFISVKAQADIVVCQT